VNHLLVRTCSLVNLVTASENRLHDLAHVDKVALKANTITIQPKPGTLPWYGPEYALDDFIVYSYYGHKREHSAQINVFRDQLAS
jgi:hypothetical protein